MREYHAKRTELRASLEAHLRIKAQAEGISQTPALDDLLRTKAEQLVEDFERAALSYRQDTFRRGFIDYWVAVSQGIVGSVIFALMLAGWYFVEFGSHQDPRELAVKALESHSATPKLPTTPTPIPKSSP